MHIVLYLEDDDALREFTSNQLRARGWIVEDFKRIDQVKEFFTEHFNEIACIITDLNMPDEWLNEHQHKSKGKMISGWIMLQEYIYTVTPTMPTIIYSGYISYLEEKLNEERKMSLLNKYHILRVGKGSREDEGFSGLQNALVKLNINP
ncbi:MAG: hypothetical protein FWE82_03710 [Defluviitaleaceae bacterium]|nr:hypothetical protein [Defluviitaleaceae bacterium]